MRDGVDPGRLQLYARLAGLAYVLQNILFLAAFGITSRMVVTGDFTATTRNIIASEHLYRLGVTMGLMGAPVTIFLAWAFYALLKGVDGNLALFALLCRAVESAFYGAVYGLYFIALDICKGAAKGLDAAGQQALWALVQRGEITVELASSVFFDFGSTIFFYLLFRARFIPRLISGFGMLASVLILIVSCLTMTLPALEPLLQIAGAPLALVETLTGLWLLFAGANTKFWNSPSAALQPN